MTIEPTIIASILGALATIIAAIISILSKKWASTKATLEETPEQTPGGIILPESVEMVQEKETRLPEARLERTRQEAVARLNRRANGFLTFSQYIVGGVLATSFIQEAFSKELVGLLGVIVLVSKLVHQHYRPDVISVGAAQRSIYLTRSIRAAEDDIFVLNNNQSGAALPIEVDKIRRRISYTLAAVEQAELVEINNRLQNAEQGASADAKKPRR